MKIFKSLLKILLVLIFLGALLYNYLADESHKLYREALVLYENKEYFAAHEKVKDAMSKNILNRKAITLKAKLYEIVKGEENYSEAVKLYEEGVDLALKGQTDQARDNFIKAIVLADDVPTPAPRKKDAEELIKKINRDAEPLLSKAPAIALRRAKAFYNQGQYRRAFENLNNQAFLSSEGRALKSVSAYRVGMETYYRISGSGNVANTEINDAIYWLKQVEEGTPEYSDAIEKQRELKELLR